MKGTRSINSFGAMVGQSGRVPWSSGEISFGSECKEHGSVLPRLPWEEVLRDRSYK